MLKTGTIVKIRSKGILGEVLDEGTVDFNDNKNYYWVKYVGNDPQVIVFCEDEMDPVGCTCGAKAAYAPYDPPGHSYHCDLKVD